jgi:3-oxoacyl-[acyl-carrier-protein] synthase III
MLCSVLRKIPKEKFHIKMGETGNTVSSTITIGLKQAIDAGNIKEKQKS